MVPADKRTAMPADTSRTDPIPYRQFGRHSDQVSIIGIGGFHLGQVKTVTSRFESFTRP